MGGIFGGLLSFFNLIGGAFLWLLIGSVASRPTDGVRTARVAIGSLLVGYLAGTIVYLSLPLTNMGDQASNAALALYKIPFVVFLIVILLEALKRWLEKDESAPHT